MHSAGDGGGETPTADDAALWSAVSIDMHAPAPGREPPGLIAAWIPVASALQAVRQIGKTQIDAEEERRSTNRHGCHERHRRDPIAVVRLIVASQQTRIHQQHDVHGDHNHGRCAELQAPQRPPAAEAIRQLDRQLRKSAVRPRPLDRDEREERAGGSHLLDLVRRHHVRAYEVRAHHHLRRVGRAHPRPVSYTHLRAHETLMNL
eukprot:7357476-Prymnesium_polylepis.2